MQEFPERAKAAILEFQEGVITFRQKVDATRRTRELPANRLGKLTDLADQATAAAVPLLDSLTLIQQTGLDLVDMETRMIGESKGLAGILRKLGGEVLDQHFIRVEFENELVELEERAQGVAGALFPSAVQGLNRVNSKLWEFSRLEMSRYRRILDRIAQEGKLTAEVLSEVKDTFSGLEGHFKNANQLLNQLAQGALKKPIIVTQMRDVKEGLKEAMETARVATGKESFRHFKSVFEATQKVGKEVSERLDGLRVPLFPLHSETEELQKAIEQGLYEELTGLQAFALLNITSRMRHTVAEERHLLSPDFHVQVWKVFPDRIYFDVDSEFLRSIEESNDFESANPSLHRFRDGSFKQRSFPEGNLQVTYQKNQDGRFSVDADIDVYRDPLLHLFGEVLINHLTGSKTDPYRVRNILDQQGVRPIGEFAIHSA